MKLKRVMSLLVTAVMICSLAACGSGKQAAPAEKEEAAAPAPAETPAQEEESG